MSKLQRVILSDDYIDILKNQRNQLETKLQDKTLWPDTRAKYEREFKLMNQRYEQALAFQDVVSELHNVKTPRIATVLTVSGRCLPIKNVQFI